MNVADFYNNAKALLKGIKWEGRFCPKCGHDMMFNATGSAWCSNQDCSHKLTKEEFERMEENNG